MEALFAKFSEGKASITSANNLKSRHRMEEHETDAHGYKIQGTSDEMPATA